MALLGEHFHGVSFLRACWSTWEGTETAQNAPNGKLGSIMGTWTPAPEPAELRISATASQEERCGPGRDDGVCLTTVTGPGTGAVKGRSQPSSTFPTRRSD